jgi:chemotaxis protein histidine kinase CheA
VTPIAVPDPDAQALTNQPATTPSPTRRATVVVNDLGIVVRADMLITPAPKDVRDLFAKATPEQQPGLVERALVIGATTLATTAELDAISAANTKLEASMDLVERSISRLDERAAAFDLKVDQYLKEMREQAGDAREEEQRLRAEMRSAQEELTKAAKEMNLTREQMEKKTGEAITDLASSQQKAREAAAETVTEAVRKLVDPADPTAAPALMKNAVDKATNDLRQSTDKNVAEVRTKLGELLGEGSPFVASICQRVREDSEREIKRLEERLSSLRDEVITERTRHRHDPTVRGEAYEDDVLELVGDSCSVYGWTVTPTGTLIGDEAASRKGDHLLVDQQDQPVAAIEARARKNVSSRDLFKSLHGAATNRAVKIAVYMAASEAELPSGLGEFSRGRLPFHYKLLPDGIHALVTVIDRASDSVAERLALVLWFISQLHEQNASNDSDDELAARRIAQALPCIAQLQSRLVAFRAIKGTLTKAGGEVNRARVKVTGLEGELIADIEHLCEILAGNADETLETEAVE